MGNCISSSINPCKMGYRLVAGACQEIDANLIRCPNRYYLGDRNICQPVDPNCDTYNNKTGACYQCYTGFILAEGRCFSGVPSNTNCPNGFFRNNLGNCEANPTNNCPPGFFRNNLGNCELIDSTSTVPSLPNCQYGFFRNIYGIC